MACSHNNINLDECTDSCSRRPHNQSGDRCNVVWWVNLTGNYFDHYAKGVFWPEEDYPEMIDNLNSYEPSTVRYFRTGLEAKAFWQSYREADEQLKIDFK